MNFRLSVSEIAHIVDGVVLGESERVLTGINKIESAQEGDITFLASSKFARFLPDCRASCILVRSDEEVVELDTTTFIKVKDPHRALVQLIHSVQEKVSTSKTGFIHRSADIDPTAQVSATAVVHAGVVVSRNCCIADGVVLHPNVVVGDNSTIERNTVVYPNATIYHHCSIGSNCIIHANAVIGSDGFGFLDNSDGSFDKIPQIGNVVIEDSVEIGAGSCVDRAALGSTIIRRGVKIDNLVHIAHNVEIGENSAIAAQTGIAGGTRLGARNRIAGQVGIVGYITTVDDVIIGAQSGVSKSIGLAGVYSGSPAVELKQRLRQEAAIRRLL